MVTIVFICVFAAVAMLAFACVRVGQAVGDERTDLVRKAQDVTVTFAKPEDRFITPQRLAQVRFAAAALLGTVSAGALMLAGVAHPAGLLIVPLIFACVGWRAPQVWVGLKVARRRAQFEASVLDLTMGLEKGLRSGQALGQAVESLVKRLEGPMQEELTVALRETRMGKDMVEAMERLQQRMPGEDMMLLVTAIRLTMKTGGSLADVLARMTEMIRGRREFQGKLQTLTAQGRFEALAIMSAPWGAFVVLYLLNTELMKPMLFCSAGWTAFGVVVALEAVGWFIIKRIVTIEV